MRRDRSKRRRPILLVLLLVPVILFSHQRLNVSLAEHGATSSLDFSLPYPSAVRLLSLGYEQLLADLYWLSFIQYVGDDASRLKDGYSKSQKYVELISSLDPALVSVYYFAAFLVGSEEHQPKVASELIDYGIEKNPNNWYLPFIGGINQYLYAHNEVKAAKYYRMASKFPDAPKWLGRQAEILQAKIPSTIKEINVWDSIYNNATDSAVKKHARIRLAALWTQVYKTSPSSEIRNRALSQLSKLGEDTP